MNDKEGMHSESDFDDLSDIPYIANPNQETYDALSPEQRRRIEAVVDAMTDEEVQNLAHKLDQLPLD